MSLVFEKEYALQWNANRQAQTTSAWWWHELEDSTCETMEEARKELERYRGLYPEKAWRIVSRDVSEWEPVEGEA